MVAAQGEAPGALQVVSIWDLSPEVMAEEIRSAIVRNGDAALVAADPPFLSTADPITGRPGPVYFQALSDGGAITQFSMTQMKAWAVSSLPGVGRPGFSKTVTAGLRVSPQLLFQPNSHGVLSVRVSVEGLYAGRAVGLDALAQLLEVPWVDCDRTQPTIDAAQYRIHIRAVAALPIDLVMDSQLAVLLRTASVAAGEAVMSHVGRVSLGNFSEFAAGLCEETASADALKCAVGTALAATMRGTPIPYGLGDPHALVQELSTAVHYWHRHLGPGGWSTLLQHVMQIASSFTPVVAGGVEKARLAGLACRMALLAVAPVWPPQAAPTPMGLPVAMPGFPLPLSAPAPAANAATLSPESQILAAAQRIMAARRGAPSLPPSLHTDGPGPFPPSLPGVAPPPAALDLACPWVVCVIPTLVLPPTDAETVAGLGGGSTRDVMQQAVGRQSLTGLGVGSDREILDDMRGDFSALAQKAVARGWCHPATRSTDWGESMSRLRALIRLATSSTTPSDAQPTTLLPVGVIGRDPGVKQRGRAVAAQQLAQLATEPVQIAESHAQRSTNSLAEARRLVERYPTGWSAVFSSGKSLAPIGQIRANDGKLADTSISSHFREAFDGLVSWTVADANRYNGEDRLTIEGETLRTKIDTNSPAARQVAAGILVDGRLSPLTASGVRRLLRPAAVVGGLPNPVDDC